MVRISLKLLSKSCLPLVQVQSRYMRTLTTRRMRQMYWRSKEFNAIDPPSGPRNQLFEWHYPSELFAFSQRLHENLSEANLRIAFTHPSYVEKEIKKRREDFTLEQSELNIISNEKFAKSGRELISDFSKKYLRYFLPKLPEEGITALSKFLLETESMAEMSKLLGTYDLIFSGEDFPNAEALADSLAAVVGVIGEEKGIPHTNKFIIDFIMTYLQDKMIFEIWDLTNPKSVLNTILTNEGLPNYEPRLLHQVGVSTILPSYLVGLYVNKKLIGQAAYETIEEAEEMAAFDALAKKFEITPKDFVFRFGKDAYDLDFDRFSKENHSIANWVDIEGKFTTNTRLDG